MSGNSYKEIFDSVKEYKDPSKYLSELVNLMSQILFDRDLFVKNSDNIEERLAFFKALQQKMEETYYQYRSRNPEAQNIIQEIEFVGSGHTHLAFRIGDMVLKVGKSKNQWTSSMIEKYRDYPCLIPVLFDKSFKIADGEYYSMQIAPMVDTSQIEEEEVYTSYKTLRNYGYIWNDPLPENTGKMMSDYDFNGHHYQKGDLVIIDLEDIAYVGEETSEEVLEEISMMSYNRKTYVYESRYLEEKGKAK
ncbi:MAG: hypothetical protein IKF71_00890 [Bacilli bacterium]|nr:hypothetical protein [Bacilli bacterium]